jgi:hypothetical protein
MTSVQQDTKRMTFAHGYSEESQISNIIPCFETESIPVKLPEP